jgi:hypothetical protein
MFTMLVAICEVVLGHGKLDLWGEAKSRMGEA